MQQTFMSSTSNRPRPSTSEKCSAYQFGAQAFTGQLRKLKSHEHLCIDDASTRDKVVVLTNLDLGSSKPYYTGHLFMEAKRVRRIVACHLWRRTRAESGVKPCFRELCNQGSSHGAEDNDMPLQRPENIPGQGYPVHPH